MERGLPRNAENRVSLHRFNPLSANDPMKDFFKSSYRWIRRYVSLTFVLVMAYVVFIAFFNENSYFKMVEYQEQIDALTAEIKENNDTMAHYRRLNRNLASDPAELERIVREHYHMQRPGEDVYVFD